ncbi:hypothetical protein [Alteromonas sp. 14N.309.X.WAT.G.H12]|uniref:hypothetical protein n=1 Tax=Alteromonas sp. 14N.309.X.WAT.G.H12 TaxID=3120824 RepID=UPI002FD09DB7
MVIKPKKVMGGIWLGTSVLLMTTVISVTSALALLIIGLNEQGIWSEQQETLQGSVQLTQAQYAARLLHLPSWSSDLPADLAASLSNISHEIINGVEVDVATVTVKQTNGLFSVSQQQDIVRFPLLLNIPPAGLILVNGITNGASFTLYLPSSTAHPVYSYSLWANQVIDLSQGTRVSCDPLIIDKTHCLGSVLSQSALKNTDIKDNDSYLPLDALDYLFGTHIDDISDDTLKAIPWQITTSCTSLDPYALFIWVEGSCILSDVEEIGSPAQPIILIIENGDIVLKDEAKIYGLVVSLQKTSLFSQQVIMHDSSIIEGSLILNHSATSNSDIQVKYDYPLLLKLQQMPQLQQLARVPGSRKR